MVRCGCLPGQAWTKISRASLLRIVPVLLCYPIQGDQDKFELIFCITELRWMLQTLQNRPALALDTFGNVQDGGAQAANDASPRHLLHPHLSLLHSGTRFMALARATVPVFRFQNIPCRAKSLKLHHGITQDCATFESGSLPMSSRPQSWTDIFMLA